MNAPEPIAALQAWQAQLISDDSALNLLRCVGGHAESGGKPKRRASSSIKRVRGRSAADATALHSILHDHGRIVEFDGRLDVKLLTNHRCDALVHERTGGKFIVPQIDSASGPAVLRTQELFPD